MTQYASKTTVSAEKSRGEIEWLLKRYGAEQFGYMWGVADDGAEVAKIAFIYSGRHIRFDLTFPLTSEFRRSDRGRTRTPAQAEKAYQQAVRQRWRALALVIKAKLEAVESGITTFEDEFLAYTVLPNGDTLGEWANRQLDASLESGRMPKLLAAGG